LFGVSFEATGNYTIFNIFISFVDVKVGLRRHTLGHFSLWNTSRLNYAIGIPVSHFIWEGTIQFRYKTYFC